MLREVLALFLVLTIGGVAYPKTDYNDDWNHQNQQRQLLNSTLGALAGALGVNHTFDYVVVGGGTAVCH